MIKIIYCLRRNPDISEGEFHRYWREDHVRLITEKGAGRGMARYTQSHTFRDERLEPLVRSRPGIERFDGVAEVWWDSIDALLAGSSANSAGDAALAILADEARFIDVANSTVFYAEEIVIFDAGRR